MAGLLTQRIKSFLIVGNRVILTDTFLFIGSLLRLAGLRLFYIGTA